MWITRFKAKKMWITKFYYHLFVKKTYNIRAKYCLTIP